MKKNLIALFILLTSCAPTIMVHPYKTAEDFERDKYECEGIAYQRTGDLGFEANPILIKDELLKCLKVKHGWRKQ